MADGHTIQEGDKFVRLTEAYVKGNNVGAPHGAGVHKLRNGTNMAH